MDEEFEEQDSISERSSNSKIRCTLIYWRHGKHDVAAEGFWHSSDPNELVNDIPLGPNAMMVFVDVSRVPKARLWRPTFDSTCIEDTINSTIAWPANKVVLEKQSGSEEQNHSSPSSVNTNNVKKKCKLLDVRGSGQVVAEGRWSSSDPNALVHFVTLGPDAMRVWVDYPKVPTAFLWRPTSEMEAIEDVVGTTIAWPADKVVMF